MVVVVPSPRAYDVPFSLVFRFYPDWTKMTPCSQECPHTSPWLRVLPNYPAAQKRGNSFPHPTYPPPSPSSPLCKSSLKTNIPLEKPGQQISSIIFKRKGTNMLFAVQTELEISVVYIPKTRLFSIYTESIVQSPSHVSSTQCVK